MQRCAYLSGVLQHAKLVLAHSLIVGAGAPPQAKIGLSKSKRVCVRRACARGGCRDLLEKVGVCARLKLVCGDVQAHRGVATKHSKGKGMCLCARVCDPA